MLIFFILFLIDLCSYIDFLPVSEAGYLKDRILSIRGIMFVEKKLPATSPVCVSPMKIF